MNGLSPLTELQDTQILGETLKVIVRAVSGGSFAFAEPSDGCND